MKIKIKRAYEIASKDDGTRILVERLWPRGIKKENLRLDYWMKDIAPSAELRKWFSHDPAKWQQFQKKYNAELDQHPEAVELLLKEIRKGPVTFLYSSHDTEHNSAISLMHYLTNG